MNQPNICRGERERGSVSYPPYRLDTRAEVRLKKTTESTRYLNLRRRETLQTALPILYGMSSSHESFALGISTYLCSVCRGLVLRGRRKKKTWQCWTAFTTNTNIAAPTKEANDPASNAIFYVDNPHMLYPLPRNRQVTKCQVFMNYRSFEKEINYCHYLLEEREHCGVVWIDR